MATFDEHITQAKNNLDFLNRINQDVPKYWDWQVTVAFYVAVHLVNAHIAKKLDQHYRSHEDVNNALNPFNELSITKLDEDLYLSYIKLQSLARRARYLCHENPKRGRESAFFTYDKHFSKAIRNLDKLIKFMSEEYSISFGQTPLSCLELKDLKSDYFKIS